MSENSILKDFGEAPFLDHLEELRWRLIKSIIAIIVGAFVAFYYSDYLFTALWYPLKQAAPELKIHYFKVTEGFITRIKLAIISGAAVASPIIFYQAWKFIIPGLYEKEIKVIVPIVIASTAFFFMGTTFCYFILLPYGLQFFYTQTPEGVEATLMMSDYLGFVMMLLLAFGAVFQLPVVSFFFGRIGLISSDFLAKGRRYAVIAIAVLAALITPPDVISQVGIGVPLYILYEISIIIVRLTGRAEKPKKGNENLAG